MRGAKQVARIRNRGMHIGIWWEGKPERKRPLGRPGRRWKGNFKIDLKEIR
jgi:hypothetical protein